jgi:hypothetical protein
MKTPTWRTFNRVDSVSIAEGSELSGPAKRDVCDVVSTSWRQASGPALPAAVYIANISDRVCAAGASAVYHYFADSHYANLNDIMIGGVVGLAVNFVFTPVGSALQNLQHTKSEHGTSDQCGNDDREKLAVDYASAIYDFCIHIKNARDTSNIPT